MEEVGVAAADTARGPPLAGTDRLAAAATRRAGTGLVRVATQTSGESARVPLQKTQSANLHLTTTVVLGTGVTVFVRRSCGPDTFPLRAHPAPPRSRVARTVRAV